MFIRRYSKYILAFCCSLLLVISQLKVAFPQDSPGWKQISKNPTNAVTSLAISADGKTVATGVEDSQIILIDAQTGQQKRTLKGHEGLPVAKVAFNPKGGKLASVGRDTVLRIWDVESGEQTENLTGHESPTRTVAYSPDGTTIASAGEDTRIALWRGNKLFGILQGHRNFVNDVAFSPDSKILASAAEDDRIIIWDVESGKANLTLLGHAAGVTSVAFSPNGKLLASASKDNTVRLWDATTGIQSQILPGPTKRMKTVAFSPNSKLLAAAGEEDTVFVWDIGTGKARGRLAKNKAAKTTAVVFNPVDDNNLITGEDDGEISVWDVAKAKKNRSIQVPAKAVPGKSLKSLKSDNLLPKVTVSSTDKTLIATIPDPPGGPILLVTSSDNNFGNYYSEILRNEGLNYFNVSDISAISSGTLNNYDVVILAQTTTLIPAQVTMFSDWVNAGGNLIAMRPDKQLASLLGLTDAGSTLANGYLLIDNTKFPGNGIVNQTIQFHSEADRYTLNNATSLATLYSNATTQTSNPAVTLRTVGSGQAAAFTFDLARSIVYTRQGNTAWAGQERDGFSPIRSDDQFYGAASTNPQPDWVDLNKVAIPQADEQQRLLANLIIAMNAAKKPLPRFWYLPNGKKAAVLMTGDDHGNGGTATRFNQFLANSATSCNVDNWECIRGTSYIYPNTNITDSQVAAYNSQGFEIALHVNTGCANYTPSSLATNYTQQLSQFSSKFPSLPAPVTQRHHCLVWSDWSSTPEVELSKGIRLDTTYYYWPPIWVSDRPGFFTGSGMPMRFAKTDGTIIDVYKAATQMTDESGQSYPFTINTVLDRALGAEGYYGVFNVNAHTDNSGATSQSVSDAVVASAKARGVSVITARQLLTWLDGRNNSSFNSLLWDSNNAQLSFSITKATGANGLLAMLPTRAGDKILSSITLNGSQVTYTTAAIKGIEYGIFAGDTGSYVASYSAPTPPELEAISPTISPSPTSPGNGATGISIGSSVVAKFNQAMDPGTINSSSFSLRDAANTVVAATVSYDAATRTATLQPTGNLGNNKTYTATLKGGTIKNQVGSAFAVDYTWSFTTAGQLSTSYQIWNNSSTPATASANDPNAVELGVKFRSDLDGYITGIRFYKGGQNTGTHVGTLWSSTGTQLAQATFTNESASGWQQVTFPNPVLISANTTYVASYHTNVGRYAINNNFFASAGVDNPPLHALSNNASGGNGVYRYGATSIFPNSNYQSSNYWVDVIFTPSTPAQTPPTVTSTTPSNNTTGISTGTTVTATFSKAMNSATINSSTFLLSAPGNIAVTGNITYDATSNTATLTPSSTLAANTIYTATIKGGSTGVLDQSGNTLSQDYTWSFTTSSSNSIGNSLTIWDNTATPSVLSENDTAAVELGVKFSSDSAGSIKGIRFYKGNSNTGNYTVNLWNNSGQLLGTASQSSLSTTGWQQFDFASPIPITANTVYVASYFTSIGRYSLTENFFASAGVDKQQLHALQNGVSGGNGVYRYGSTSGFPNSTYRSSNYWVDVEFIPAATP
ncbi:WD-40 repeat-containing protein [Calothrix brevissima NIES-22]|nr:WD-40 repeat-containing protein [Calothrix brevissima NIES-22]